MNKIILAALSAAFPSINCASLLEVVNATPNPVVATEKLIGCYEPPVIPELSNCYTERWSKEYSQARFVSFDQWTNKVTCTVDRTRTDSDGATTVSTDTRTTDLEDWLKYAV